MHLCSLQTDSQREQKKFGERETQEFGEQSFQGRTGELVDFVFNVPICRCWLARKN